MPVHTIDIADLRADARPADLEQNAPADSVAVDVFPQMIEVSLPPEPGIGAVLIGKTGRAFQRFPGLPPTRGLWWPAVDGGRVTLGCTWGDLLTEQAPLYLVQGARPEAVHAG